MNPVSDAKTTKAFVTRVQPESDREPLAGEIHTPGVKTGQNEIVQTANTAGLDAQGPPTGGPPSKKLSIPVPRQGQSSIPLGGRSIALQTFIGDGQGMIILPCGEEKIG